MEKMVEEEAAAALDQTTEMECNPILESKVAVAENQQQQQDEASRHGQTCGSSNILKPVTVTPDRLKLPKAFKYPERYTSPTDLIVSPISRGLMARTKKATPPLPPFKRSSTKSKCMLSAA